MKTIFFFGLSPIIRPAVEWLEANAIPFAIVADSNQEQNAWPELPTHSIQSIENLTNFDSGSATELVGLSIGSPWRFDDTFINGKFKGQLFNLHGTPLPIHRGGNIYSWFVLNGVRAGISLLHRMSAGLDAGPVIRYEEFLYPAGCKKPIDYIRSYEKINGEFLLQIVKDISNGWDVRDTLQQPEYLATYLPRLKSDVNGWIPWDLPGVLLERFICAFDEPYDGARTEWRGKCVLLKDVHFQPGFDHHPFEFGNVLRKNSKWITIAVHGGELFVTSIFRADKGNVFEDIQPGDRLATRADQLDAAKQRVVKRKNGLQPQDPW